MALFALLALVSLLDFAAVSAAGDQEQLGSGFFKPEIVEAINSNPSIPWTAHFNLRLHTLSKEALKASLGTYRNPPEGVLPVKKFPAHKFRLPGFAKARNGAARKELGAGEGTKGAALLELPASFDAREKWAHCPTISHIRDQGHCGSCWAFGAVEVLSDRFCVHHNESVDLSTEDLLSCCGILCGDGCEGGWPYKAWKYFHRMGVVTESCQPYFDQEGCKHPGCVPVYPTPKCGKVCKDGETFKGAKHFAGKVYMVEPTPEAIMAEVYENGPVEVDFDVYEDFTYYKEGVYQHTSGEMVGGHAVKLVGWGTTPEGVDFWTIANSWNEEWGEKGYFRIVRGVNDCGIESEATAGIPLPSGLTPSLLDHSTSPAVQGTAQQ